jgi:hypothetical protein
VLGDGDAVGLEVLPHHAGLVGAARPPRAVRKPQYR